MSFYNDQVNLRKLISSVDSVLDDGHKLTDLMIVRQLLSDNQPLSLFFTNNFSSIEGLGPHDAELLDAYLRNANNLHHAMKTYFKDNDGETSATVSRRIALKEMELKQNWVDWRHRTIRWVFGAAVIVFLYSALVELSCYLDVVHIPVRELLI